MSHLTLKLNFPVGNRSGCDNSLQGLSCCIHVMRHFSLSGANGISFSISTAAGASPIRTVSFEEEVISNSFDSTIFPAFFSKIILMGW